MTRKTGFFVFFAIIAAVSVFGQTAQQKYQEARAAEYRSDHAASRTEKEAYIGLAFDMAADAAVADPRYVPAFAEIARKCIARSKQPYFFMTDRMEKVGKKRAGDPMFQGVATEFVAGYKRELLRQGYAPGKPFVQRMAGRPRNYCNVPRAAENIYRLSLFLYPVGSAEVQRWGKYAAGLHMMKLRGCGGEGGDEEPNPARAYPIYLQIRYQLGVYKAGKMLGDDWMERFIFGGVDEDPNYTWHQPGYQPFYAKATEYYRGGGVPRSEIRATILRCLRRAENPPFDKTATDLARKTLAETF